MGGTGFGAFSFPSSSTHLCPRRRAPLFEILIATSLENEAVASRAKKHGEEGRKGDFEKNPKRRSSPTRFSTLLRPKFQKPISLRSDFRRIPANDGGDCGTLTPESDGAEREERNGVGWPEIFFGDGGKGKMGPLPTVPLEWVHVPRCVLPHCNFFRLDTVVWLPERGNPWNSRNTRAQSSAPRFSACTARNSTVIASNAYDTSASPLSLLYC